MLVRLVEFGSEGRMEGAMWIRSKLDFHLWYFLGL
jgi:hypothetical protein